jgi:circadian clock protein KaiC
MCAERTASKAATGVPGLDDVLSGGLTRGCLFLLEGNPGTGKTTIAIRFLMEGARAEETSLYVTLSETKKELLESAASHGWDLDDRIEIFELQPADAVIDPNRQQSLLYSSDLELGETIKVISGAVRRIKPTRIVIDSLSEIRLLAQSSLRYRRQLLALKHYFAQNDATVLALDDLTAEALDKTAHSIAHGVIRLEELSPNYGAERRRMRVMKYRGQAFRGGYHDFTIKTGGVQVFPRLVSAEHKSNFKVEVLSSGLRELDALLGGGIEKGTSALVLGPAGSGKSLLMFQFIAAAVRRGEQAAIFVFDECCFVAREAWASTLKRSRMMGSCSSIRLMLPSFHRESLLTASGRAWMPRKSEPSSSIALTAIRPQCRRSSRSFCTCMNCFNT